MKTHEFRIATRAEYMTIDTALKEYVNSGHSLDNFRELYRYIKKNYKMVISKAWYDAMKRKEAEERIKWKSSAPDPFLKYVSPQPITFWKCLNGFTV